MKNLFYDSDHSNQHPLGFHLVVTKKRVGERQGEIEKYLDKNKIDFMPRGSFALINFKSGRSMGAFKRKFSDCLKKN